LERGYGRFGGITGEIQLQKLVSGDRQWAISDDKTSLGTVAGHAIDVVDR